MIFGPPSSDETNPWLYITKLPITKSSRSYVDKCYNEPLRRDGEHSRNLVSSSDVKRRQLQKKEVTMRNERDEFGKGLGLHL
jgi:hypothetical protein